MAFSETFEQMDDGIIDIGDDVKIVLWPCCGGQIGKVFRVEWVWFDVDMVTCIHCGKVTYSDEPVIGEFAGLGAFFGWLEKIPSNKSP